MTAQYDGGISAVGPASKSTHLTERRTTKGYGASSIIRRCRRRWAAAVRMGCVKFIILEGGMGKSRKVVWVREFNEHFVG